MYLNCHSYYSLRYGVLSIDELVSRGKAAGTDVLCLTDINTMTGVYDFVAACQEQGIKPVVGIEFRNDNQLEYVCLARNHAGFAELNAFLSGHNLDKTPFPPQAPDFDHCYVIYSMTRHPHHLRDNEYIGIRPQEVNKLVTSPLRGLQNKLVVWQPVTLNHREGFQLHQLLRCVDQNILLTQLQEEGRCQPTEWFISIDKLLERYERFPQIVLNTVGILSHCGFDFDFNRSKNLSSYTGSPDSDKALLERLALEGMERRYGKNNAEAEARTRRELEVIDNLGFAAYFLTTWDIIRYSSHRGFQHVGRGSGANSIIAYELYITDVCPLELDLYFERFLNPSRTSPPDFDIDWSWKDRDEILSYIFDRFDRDKTAFVGTIGTFKRRSIIHELGKVFGLQTEERKRISSNPLEVQNNPEARRIAYYAEQLSGFPNLRSMHSCGVVITDVSKYNYMAVDLPPKGFPTAQIDMYICEDINLEKLDILSQRGLGHIHDAVQLVERNHSVRLDMHEVAAFKEDDKCNEMLASGKTLGCFYIESPAMRGLLRRLQCDNYLTLVAASSIIRPGVAKSGMMREYIERHNGKKFEYPHPVFEEQMSDTYGIMVYQEDVIKVAHYFAGLDLSDADILRRAMSGKKRKVDFNRVTERYYKNCKKRGYSEQLTDTIYKQIESFAGYSFCKSHSASYAVESYQSLYLKAHYPLEFITGVINNFGGFYRTEVYIHEARMAGATIHNPCVNHSLQLTDLDGTDLWLGFIHLKGLEKGLQEGIPKERQRRGPFKSLEDFIQRVAIPVEQLQLLVNIGAFRFTGLAKGALTLKARLLLKNLDVHQLQGSPTLFEPPTKTYTVPTLEHGEYDDVFDELELLQFPVSKSPWELIRSSEEAISLNDKVRVANFMKMEGKRVKMFGYLISRKPVPAVNGNMSFGTWVDASGDYFDTVHFPEVLERFPFNAPGVYLIEGKVVVEYNFSMVEVLRVEHQSIMADPRYEDSQTNLPIGRRDNLPFTLGRKAYPGSKERDGLFGNGKAS